uniref:VWFA domain-containing protein n=2 Tax=Caenorhabditis tropicalis TaxID=1561998 RepID=A0A1I7UTE3_9PELO
MPLPSLFTIYEGILSKKEKRVDTCGQTSSSEPVYADRECGQNLSTLWLDVIAVVDNSIGMTNDGLSTIAANIVSVFSQSQIGTNPQNPQTTRVGLITYNQKAYQNADLNKYQSVDDLFEIFYDLNSTSNVEQSILSAGLAKAENLFAEESSGTISRSHYKKVVIVYASSYRDDGPNDPIPVANRLKGSGITIVTVGFDQAGDGELLKKLANVATPGYNFTNTEEGGNLLGRIQGALIETNCFCPTNWIQYRQNHSDPNSYRYGVCIELVGMAAVWKAAKMSCANRWKNSYMVNEYNQQKHDFVLDVVKDNQTGFSDPFSYHIGLSLVSGKWRWDQPNGWEQPILQYWFHWNPMYPTIDSTLTVVLNAQDNEEVATGWENTGAMSTPANYICETSACDTDNYCSSAGR